jgi:long-chain fatty acid transport protein
MNQPEVPAPHSPRPLRASSQTQSESRFPAGRAFPPPVARPALLLGACASLALLNSGDPARAEGFRSPTTGTAGLGATGGRTVFIDDASAVFHNPANLMELDRWEAAAEPTIVYHSVDYTSPAGGTAGTERPWKFLPHVFAGGPIIEDRLAAGIGISVPYGLSIDWGQGDALRYIAPSFVELKTFNFNPSIALKVVEGLHVGVGLDVMYSELTLKQFAPWFLIPGMGGAPDGEFVAEGTGTGVSANVGVAWEFLPRHHLAATVRAPMTINYDGDFTASAVPGVPGGKLDLPFDSQIRFPTIVTFGYGFEVTDSLRIEANVEWLEFSRFETLPLGVPTGDAPLLAALLPSEVRQDWDDTFTVGISATWDLGRGWRARGSYQFFESPVPDETFSPSIPDSAQHAIAAGVEYRSGRHRFGAAYSRVFYEDRKIDVPTNMYSGDYEFEVHLISAAYGFSF